MATPQIRSSKTESYTDNKRKDDVRQFNIIAARFNQDLQGSTHFPSFLGFSFFLLFIYLFFFLQSDLGFVDLQMNTPKMRRHEPKTTSSSNSKFRLRIRKPPPPPPSPRNLRFTFPISSNH
jgi:hypothetical protein